MHGKTMEIFWYDGTGDGIVTAELSNWNGEAIKIPRKEMDVCSKEFDEVNGAGVYFLFCEKENTNGDSVYIGETENILERLVQHIHDYNSDKDKFYWHTAIAFVGKDLNKANIRFIENELFETAKSLGVDVLTKNTFKNTVLKKSQKAAALEFIDNIKVLLHALGYTILKEKPKETSDTVLLYCKGKTSEATGYVSTNGFMVMKDSRVSDHVFDSLKKHMKSYAALRQQLEESGIIVDGIFQENYEFKSPSAAACVVHGRSSNGLTDWKTADGTKLKDL
ncbi:MAG: GIY-YIG nuclease family protein [Selenomonas sp.]|nr:GIY-YIG nuclease family protein [Selenomonas sp.]